MLALKKWRVTKVAHCMHREKDNLRTDCKRMRYNLDCDNTTAPSAYIGTPSFRRRYLHHRRNNNLDLACVLDLMKHSCEVCLKFV